MAQLNKIWRRRRITWIFIHNNSAFSGLKEKNHGSNHSNSNGWWLLRLIMGWVLGQPPNVPSVSFLTTALWDNNYSHFTEEETESGRAIQLVRELVFAHQYMRLLSTTCNNFSRDFLVHWRERTSQMWRHVWQKAEDRALWHWGGVMTLLPQEGGEGLLPSCPSGTLTNCFIKYPSAEGTAFPTLFFLGGDGKRCLYWRQASNFTLHNEYLSKQKQLPGLRGPGASVYLSGEEVSVNETWRHWDKRIIVLLRYCWN